MAHIRLDEYPLIAILEEVLVDELDRQHLNELIEPGATGDAYFDAIDGDLCGRPDWNAVVKAVIVAYRDEVGE